MSTPSGPDRALLVGLLLDAIEALLRADEGKAAARRAHDARVWMAAEDPEWPFSFAVVCRVLAVDGAALRTALRAATPPIGVGSRLLEAARRFRPRSQPPIR